MNKKFPKSFKEHYPLPRQKGIYKVHHGNFGQDSTCEINYIYLN